MRRRLPARALARLAALAALASMGALAASCAYYNTFYLARKYYDIAALRQPYLVDRPTTVDNLNFNKSIDYSKKVIGQYTKSKWVDDAYLLWARALLGKDDPRQTVNMLQDFAQRYPNSPIKNEAQFYLGVAYRQALKYTEAERELSEFLAAAPRHELAPYASLELARARVGLKDYPGAVTAATKVVDRGSHTKLLVQARTVRANASLLAGDFGPARADFHELQGTARDDEERLGFVLREADCLEAAHDYDAELALLKGAQSHETAPIPPPEPVPGTATSPNVVVQGIQTPQGVDPNANDRYGRLEVRIGTVMLLQGKVDAAVASYRDVAHDYPHTPLAAEAQYRVGYAYETTADDFDKARAEYARVREIANSAFATQAAGRLANLDRLATFKAAGGDTLESQAEKAFLLAEQYLFQIGKPDRALEEYRSIERRFAGTPYAAKAITAQAWVLSRKLERRAEADSLFWKVVRDHPATEAQLAARDYLEMEGADVPADLIQMPLKPLLAHADTIPALTPAPTGVSPLGGLTATGADSLGLRRPPAPFAPGAAALNPPGPAPGLEAGTPLSPAVPYVGPPPPSVAPIGPPAPQAGDSPALAGPPAPGPPATAPVGPGGGAPTAGASTAPRDTSRAAPRDTLRAPADTSRVPRRP